jgi:hypothetical protein
MKQQLASNTEKDAKRSSGKKSVTRETERMGVETYLRLSVETPGEVARVGIDGTPTAADLLTL